MQAVYDGLANAQPQTGALRKAVFFVKAFEDMFLGVFRDTASRVFDKDGGISFPVRDIAEGDAARYREFLGIVYPKSVIRISLCRTAKRNPLIFPI